MSSIENDDSKLLALLETDTEFQTSEFRMTASKYSERSVSTPNANDYLKAMADEGLLERKDQGMLKYSKSKNHEWLKTDTYDEVIED